MGDGVMGWLIIWSLVISPWLLVLLLPTPYSPFYCGEPRFNNCPHKPNTPPAMTNQAELTL